LIICCYIDRL